MKSFFHLIFIVIVMNSLSACKEIEKAELLSKIKGKNSPEELVMALGKPDVITHEGALLHWRYTAKGGDVCFTAVGAVAMRMICP